MIKQNRLHAALLVTVAALCCVRSANAQYFGRNKVQYENFDWRILKSDHFDLFFYPAESLKVHDAGREEERWYARLSEIFRHQFDRKTIVFYADHPDFEQTNVISESPSEGTGGVTEGLRTRVVLPFTGVYHDDEHVIGHELVHVFQYNIAETSPGTGGLARLNALPLWLIEGMAEYFSLGRNHELTAMWMRDAVMQDSLGRYKFPTIRQITTDPRYFPYRYGQALWAYIGGRWGDRAIVDVYRTALRVGWDQALVRALGLSQDSLSKDWAAANRAFYAGQVVGRTHPDSAGRIVVRMRERSEYNIGPAQSADGKYVAFFTSKTSLFGIELVMADAQTGKIIRKLTGPQSDGHFDNISFINSSGDWSPDGSRFAFIVYANGDNEIDILNTANGRIERHYRPDDVGAVYQVAWSPSGREIAFSGSKGGISDLYLLNVETGAVRQLTNDRYAQIQPTFSPDGRTIAFATDQGPGTSFENLTFGDLQLATMDVATGQITVLPGFARGKHINPQFSPDGRNLFFVSDQDGVSDIYRMDLSTRQIYRITRLATGVSGITEISPAITVAQGTGNLMFTVFKDQGHQIVSLVPSQLVGVPIDAAGSVRLASAATLPPGDVAGNVTVAAYLGDPQTGLVSGSDFRVVPYHASFALDALGQPSLGVRTGGYFGTGFVGGISALWGDQLGDQQIYSVVQANGTVKDFGGALYYQNLKRRLNWLSGVEHVPYLSGFAFLAALPPPSSNLAYVTVIQRLFVDQAQVLAQYPFSTTRRFEMGVSGTRLAWEQQVDSLFLDSFLRPVNRSTGLQSGGPALYYAQASAAFVGDNAFGAFTSPVSGMRYRFEFAPTVGGVKFNTTRADARRYFFKFRPLTFAFRGMHYGRYSGDADNYRKVSPIFLGDETLIRGYGYSTLISECNDRSNLDSARNRCPVFDRLLGSKVAVFNAEIRIPLFGTPTFGLVDFPYLPLEVAPFFDAGLAWTGDQQPDLRFASSAQATPASCANNFAPTLQGFSAPCAQRIPVFSTGVSFRMNVLGYMILETYVAHPFQRNYKSWVVGIQMVPGW